MFIRIIFSFILITTSIFAQSPKPCKAKEAKQFDFWLGNWEATWSDSVKGSNSISKILDGCVVYEEFNGSPGSPLMGKSYSVYNPRSGKWQQTWVDNQGSYLDFVGQWQDDRMILSRSFELKGKVIMQRMVWYNISHEKFDWNWERSDDGGKSWKTNWQIHYTRK